MNLYRLDPSEPTDPLWRTLRATPGGPRGAMAAARARADRLDAPVTVSRIDGRTHRVKPVYIANPDGTSERPS